MFPIDSSNGVGVPAELTTSQPSKANAQQQKLKNAAGEFESILLASLWKSMKQSFGSQETEADPAHGTLDDWGIEIMSSAVGKAGGLGLGKLILEHLAPKADGVSEEKA
jgi:Rod binding domain-containing protein